MNIALIRQTGQSGAAEHPRCTVKPFGLVLEEGTMKSRALKSSANTMSFLRGALEVPLVARYSEGRKQAKYAREMAAMDIKLSRLNGIL